MKATFSAKNTLELSKSDTKNLIDEMRYACREVSVFPVMERVLAMIEV